MYRRLLFFIIGLSVVFGIVFASPSTQAQSNLTWSAQYFNNTNLSGSPTATATLSDLNINWGQTAPATGVAADNWTARFNTISYFNTGTYRFSVKADDAFRLYVHGQLLIDTFSNPRPDQLITADMNITAGYGGVQIDYREYTGPAFLYVSWQQISGTTNPLAPTNVPVTGAWTAQYFNNTNLSGNPTFVSYLDNPNINWGTASPATGVAADNWTARFSSTIYFNAGTYRFNVKVDDAIRLYVQNKLVLDTFSYPRPDTPMTVDVVLSAGNTYIQIDYREYIGPAFMYVTWSQISTSSSPIPNPGGTQLTINTGKLNLRSTPYIGDNVITQLPYGTSYPIIGRTASSDWYQIQVGQSVGWVSAQYVIASNTANVPVVSTQVAAPNVPSSATGYSLTAIANVNIRSGAGLNYSRLGILPYAATASILARNSNYSWWLVSYNGVTGWVYANYVRVPANINYAVIPVR